MSCPTDHHSSTQFHKLLHALFYIKNKKMLFSGLLFFAWLGILTLTSSFLSPTLISPMYSKQTSYKTVAVSKDFKKLPLAPTIVRNTKQSPTPTITPSTTPKKVFVVLPTLVPTAVPTSPLAMTTENSDAVNKLIGLINDSRSQHGAPALRLDSKLSGCALNHSKAMAAKNGLFHDLQNDVCDNSMSMAENVGMSTEQPLAADVTIHNGMMSEGPGGGHYENIINPKYDHIGIGIYYQGNTSWISEDFGGN